MSNPNSYEGMTLKELKRLPEVRTYSGWHEMKKGEIMALLQAAAVSASKKKGKGAVKPASSKNPANSKSVPVKPVKKEASSAQSAKTSVSSVKKEKKTAVSPAPASEMTQKSAKKSTLKEAKPAKKSNSPKSVPAAEAKAASAPASSQLKNLFPEKPSENLKGKQSPASRLAVFPDAESERISRSRINNKEKEKPAKPAAESKKNPEIIESGQTEEDRQRANTRIQKMNLRKTLETPSIDGRPAEDRLLLSVCGPFWLHACWEISGTLINRIRAAMGYLWHTADPVLRLYRITSNMAGIIHREYVNDLAIFGGVYNWYISVDDPPNSFLVEIGYKARDGQFFSLISSNIVETPQNYLQDGCGFGMSLANQMFASPNTSMPGHPGSDILSKSSMGRLDQKIDIQVDADVVIKGKTSPDAQVTIKGERVWLQNDGTFVIRYNLPDKRHLFPIVAVTRDGMEMKTVVLAIERNTKNLETVIRDSSEEE